MGRRRKESPTAGEVEEERPPYFFGAASTSMVRILAVSLFALLVRVLVALGPYSGRRRPPMYGDYEWYRNTSSNDLAYWGLDYPPLTAYQSYVHGRLFLQPFVPDSMDGSVVGSSRIFPAALCFVFIYFGRRIRRGRGDGSVTHEWLLAMILLNPCLILIDHGHFQYNCISLGFMIGAVAAILSGRELLGSFLFCLSLNHKQMSAYYAPAFFAHLLGKCLRRHNPILSVMKLAIVVLATFVLMWWPYLYSLDAAREVLSRLAPFERGIYEDYVANFWCSTSTLIKWKMRFTVKSLKLFSLYQVPSNHGFLHALLNSSFSFYLFSYQVHEKSILLPLIPASLLALEEPTAFGWLTYTHSLLSLFGLIYRLPIEVHGRRRPRIPWKLQTVMALSSFSSALLHLVYLIVRPPRRYPFLFEALIMALCFAQFVILAIYSNIRQWTLRDASPGFPSEKKKI
ncbi:unnamed protein product [Spirodela intermedia]|uniref:Alpha-1,3-glucosyltransferase n=1 Tax=Spirodela intermedia TaxID=51605 RepID=A0A7I8IAX0_SPIIN|nr:unnamed protein product [Spirodela intermedia]CAA6654544.1 unnamed protein product [Spirodela intermedia]